MVKWNFISPVVIQEGFDPMVIEVTALPCGVVSQEKRHYYRIEEGKKISDLLLNVPVRYGQVYDLNRFQMAHSKYPTIGRVIKAWFDRESNRVKAWLRLDGVDLVSGLRGKIAEGRIFSSIGGKGWTAPSFIRELGVAVKNMIVDRIDHLQLLEEPNFPDARVDRIIQETLHITEDDGLTITIQPDMWTRVRVE